MKQITLLLFLLLSVLGIYAQELKITEIMYNPENAENDWEWVEVYNSGLEPIDLSGYVIDDNSGAVYSEANIESGTIDVGMSAVLFNASATTEEQFRQAWGNVNLIPVSRWSTLNNTGDSIGIWASIDLYMGDNVSQLNVIEQVAYDSGGMVWPDNDGSGSIYLTDINADNSVGDNWALSMVDEVTPLFTVYNSTPFDEDFSVDVGSPGIPNGIEDTEKPVITICPEDVVITSDIDNCGVSFPLVLPTATDNSVEALTFEGTRSDNLNLIELFPVGETTITWTAIDEAGNVSEPCFQVVLVNDEVPPTITCPENIVATSIDGNSMMLEIETAEAFNLCEGELTISGSRDDQLELHIPYPIGETIIVWKAVDASGNFNECTQTITVNNGASSNNSITVFSIEGQIGETSIDIENNTVMLIMPFGTNVEALTPVLELPDNATVSPASEEVNDFSSPVSYIVTAQDGSSQEWIVSIAVEDDTTEPTIECPADITIQNDEGECGAVVEFDILFSDEQSEVILVVSMESGSFFPIGTTEVVATATDGNENTTTCTFNVIVEDSFFPILDCKEAIAQLDADGNVNILITDVYSTVSDNCEIEMLTASKLSFSETDLGENEVMVTATDVNGNATTCIAIVTVVPFEVSTLLVSSFTLVNADTNEDLFSIEEGMRIDINSLPTLHLDIRANTTDEVESVRLSLEGALATSRTESLLPYALFQDLPIGDYMGSDFGVGEYEVTAIPYEEDRLKGEMGSSFSVNFEFVDSCENFEVVFDVITDVLTCGGSDGGAIVATIGGEAPISYSWSHDETLSGPNATNLVAGTYVVIATDVNNCSAELTFIFKDPELPEVSLLPFESVFDDSEPIVLIEGQPIGGSY